MARYLVIRERDGRITPWNHDEYRETGAIILHEPGKDLLLIEDAGKEEDAKDQAEAYWNGTHQSPEPIDRWVEEAKSRKRELPAAGTR